VLAQQVLTKQLLYHISHTCSPFFSGYFGDGEKYLSRLPSNSEPQISAYQVARITGVSHWCLAKNSFLRLKKCGSMVEKFSSILQDLGWIPSIPKTKPKIPSF
jgi:hypothetical protein